ncbi:MAG: hypothetical protein NC410_04500 [Oscillibacter sp.]|nr:hypothetical protein [Oscillibacter sp.]
MKRLVVLISLICIGCISIVRANIPPTNLTVPPIGEGQNDSTSYKNIVTYKLFPTQNMWTFIKLNTRNGQMWQVQYDTKGDNRIETFLNLSPLVCKEKEINGRFTLYPTQNIYNFILLDQIDGKIWQVQWSFEFENRLIWPIQ